MNYDNSQQKIDVLKAVYSELHQHVRASESFENKIAFSVSTLLIIFSGFMIKENISMNIYEIYSLSFFVTLVSAMTVWFLVNNNRRIKFQCTIIVNVEKSFLLYKNGIFLTAEDRSNQTEDRSNQTQSVDYIFPESAMMWGKNQDRLLLKPHIVSVVLSGVGALLSLIFSPGARQILFTN